MFQKQHLCTIVCMEHMVLWIAYTKNYKAVIYGQSPDIIVRINWNDSITFDKNDVWRYKVLWDSAPG